MKYTEQTVPEGVRVHVVHLHEGNCSRNKLKSIGQTTTKYVTIAKLIDERNGQVIGMGKAVCSKVDSPTRKVGRAIAVGRACASYWNETGDRNACE